MTNVANTQEAVNTQEAAKTTKTIEINPKSELTLKVEAKAIEFNNLVAKVTNNEQKLQNAGVVLIEQVIELCHLVKNNKLDIYPTGENKDSLYRLLDIIIDNIYNSTIDNGMSKYAKDIIFDVIKDIKNNPDDMIEILTGGYTLSLSNFKKLTKLIEKIGTPQNKELPEYKWRFDNITTDKKGGFIFVKDQDVLDFEEKLKTGVQYSTNPAKALKYIIKTKFGGEKPKNLEEINELVEDLKGVLIKQLNTQVEEALQA